MKDNVALLGHTALMNEDDKYIVNQSVGLIRKNNDINIDYPFLYILTNSQPFLSDLRSRANSGVQVNLSTNEIRSTEVIIPDKALKAKFSGIVTPMSEKIFLNTKEIGKLTVIRDNLLPKLMSGEIDVDELMNEALIAEECNATEVV
jgi:type I restriction enzyme S subunit